MPQRIDLDLQAIISEYRKGTSASQIAREVDCSVYVILSRLREAGVDIRTKTQNEVRIPDLTPEKRQNLVELVDGLLLGDGSMDPKGFFRLDQTEKRWGWIDQLIGMFESLGVESKTLDREPRCTFIEDREIQGSRLRTLYTRSYRFMKEQRDRWYPQGIKTIPRDIKLTPLVLTHWFCGDGSYTKDGGLILYTNNFTHEEVCRLSILLNFSLGAHNNVYELRPEQWIIRILRKADAVKIRNAIQPFMPECFLYKLQHVRESLRYSSSKFTDDQVREIRQLRASTNLPYKQIAERFGVGWTCIQKICTRTTYKHIE